MAFTLPNGTSVDIAQTYGAWVNMTAVTNAAEAVATMAAGHGYVVGDYLELESGWGRLNGRVVRVKTVSSNDVTLEGIATTNTGLYPAGSGTGRARKITAWQGITQIKNDGISVGGGEQQFADITTLADTSNKQIPTLRSAQNLSIEVFDDPSLSYVPVVTNYADTSTPAAVRLSYPNGSKTVASGYWSIAKMPTITPNQALTTRIDMTISADPTRYAT